jgi:hypothetical protein
VRQTQTKSSHSLLVEGAVRSTDGGAAAKGGAGFTRSRKDAKGADDPESDFATIGDEEGLDHFLPFRRAIRLMSPR